VAAAQGSSHRQPYIIFLRLLQLCLNCGIPCTMRSEARLCASINQSGGSGLRTGPARQHSPPAGGRGLLCITLGAAQHLLPARCAGSGRRLGGHREGAGAAQPCLHFEDYSDQWTRSIDPAPIMDDARWRAVLRRRPACRMPVLNHGVQLMLPCTLLFACPCILKADQSCQRPVSRLPSRAGAYSQRGRDI